MIYRKNNCVLFYDCKVTEVLFLFRFIFITIMLQSYLFDICNNFVTLEGWRKRKIFVTLHSVYIYHKNNLKRKKYESTDC